MLGFDDGPRRPHCYRGPTNAAFTLTTERMGLTIHFELGLPATTPRSDVIDRLERLRAAATMLPFANVGDVALTRAGEALGDGLAERPQLERCFRMWAWLQVEHGRIVVAADQDADAPLEELRDVQIATVRYEADDDIEDGVLPEAAGFAVDVGVHCEPAMFGLAWVPPRDAQFRQLDDEPPVWRWHCSCKTQYASMESDEHFIRCHTALVALLDEARLLGFEVDVTDEGEYWEARDLDRLVAHLRHINHVMAEFSGALHDAIGEEHEVEAEIFKHPNFERLEMRQ